MVTNNILKIVTFVFATQSFLSANNTPHPKVAHRVNDKPARHVRHVGPGPRNIHNIGPTNMSNEEVKDVSIVGPTTMSDVGARSIDITGNLTFKSLIVADKAIVTGPIEKSSKGQFGYLRVIGPVEMSDIHCNKLSITGPSTLVRAHVTGHSTFSGPLKTTGCVFKTMRILADEIELKDTHTTTIVIKKHHSESGFLSWVGKKSNPGSRFLAWCFGFFGYNSYEKRVVGVRSEILTLSGNSKIGGDITFESKRGHVIIMPGAIVTGTITGGTVEKR